jgi:poly-beta-1,6-N-acetyl-D-glucosamine synthase
MPGHRLPGMPGVPYTGQQLALDKGQELRMLRSRRIAEAPAGPHTGQMLAVPDVPPHAKVIALVPAHNEAATIAATIASLRRQTLPPSRVVVVCDNCADDTAAIARRCGAEVIATEGNTARKAGALNYALAEVLPYMGRDDLLLAMDADSSLSSGWIAAAASVLEEDRHVGAVCGVFLGEPGGGLVGQIQRNEYFRYARIIQRRWQALVLSGTGTLFRVRALQEVGRERGRRLPGVPGQFYNHASITEDDEITLAVKTLGWKCLCPPECETTTEVMPTWSALWTQRMRWQKGTLGDLNAYGLTRVTRSYWARQAGLYGGFAASYICLLIMACAVVFHPGVSVLWTAGILSMTLAERTWTVRRAGRRGMLLAVAILPEGYYALFQGWLFFAAAWASIRRHEIAWGHVKRESVAS